MTRRAGRKSVGQRRCPVRLPNEEETMIKDTDTLSNYLAVIKVVGVAVAAPTP